MSVLLSSIINAAISNLHTGNNSFSGVNDFSSGVIKVPTRPAGDSTLNAASTEFVQQELVNSLFTYGAIYANTTVGLANTANGKLFLVMGSGEFFANLYQNVSGNAVSQNLSEPSKALWDRLRLSFETTQTIGRPSWTVPVDSSSTTSNTTYTFVQPVANDGLIRYIRYFATANGTLKVKVLNLISGNLVPVSTSNVTVNTTGSGVAVNISVNAGQYIGFYGNGLIDRDTSNAADDRGYWATTGELLANTANGAITTSARLQISFDLGYQTLTQNTVNAGTANVKNPLEKVQTIGRPAATTLVTGAAMSSTTRGFAQRISQAGCIKTIRYFGLANGTAWLRVFNVTANGNTNSATLVSTTPFPVWSNGALSFTFSPPIQVTANQVIGFYGPSILVSDTSLAADEGDAWSTSGNIVSNTPFTLTSSSTGRLQISVDVAYQAVSNTIIDIAANNSNSINAAISSFATSVTETIGMTSTPSAGNAATDQTYILYQAYSGGGGGNINGYVNKVEVQGNANGTATIGVYTRKQGTTTFRRDPLRTVSVSITSGLNTFLESTHWSHDQLRMRPDNGIDPDERLGIYANTLIDLQTVDNAGYYSQSGSRDIVIDSSATTVTQVQLRATLRTVKFPTRNDMVQAALVSLGGYPRYPGSYVPNLYVFKGEGDIVPLLVDSEYKALWYIDRIQDPPAQVLLGLQATGSSSEFTPPDPVALTADIPTLTDWIHFLADGESLSVGAQGLPVITTTQPYSNLTFGAGVKATKANSSAGGTNPGTDTVSPLIEDTLNGDGQTQRGETGLAVAGNYFLETRALRGISLTANIVFASTAGHGGYRMDQVANGTTWYQNFIDHVTDAHMLAQNAGKSYSVPCILFCIGVNDIDDNTSVSFVRDEIMQFANDASNTIQSITNQTFKPHMFLPITSYGAANSTMSLAMMQACDMHPRIHRGPPSYFLTYSSGGKHYDAIGYGKIGAHYARAVDRLYAGYEPDKITWVRGFLRGNTITAIVNTPRPLIIDTVSLASTANMGFRVTSDSGDVAITDGGITVSGNTVTIRLETTPGTNPKLRYALDYLGTGSIIGGNGAGGNLRDTTSDTVWIGGQEYPLWHPAPPVILDLTVLGG